MNIGELAFAAILARNIYRYKMKAKGSLKVRRCVYKDSLMFFNLIKAKYIDVIPEDYWMYYYLHKFFIYIKSGKTDTVQEAVALYKKEELDFFKSLN